MGDEDAEQLKEAATKKIYGRNVLYDVGRGGYNVHFQ